MSQNILTSKVAWVWCRNIDVYPVFGKWLIYRSFSEVEDAWKIICDLINSDKIRPGAKVSTKWASELKKQGNCVICVYTSEDDVDKIGGILVNIFKEHIVYKTDAATNRGEYADSGFKAYREAFPRFLSSGFSVRFM